MPRTIAVKSAAGIVLSAVLLVASYPRIEWWPLMWGALVPFLFVLDGKSAAASFGWAYLLGVIYFFSTLGWLVHVTWPGACLLMLYLALYFGIFGWLFKVFRGLPMTGRLVVYPAVWTVLEFIRDHLFTGFGWAMLGHSQYQNLLLIQIADITGVYGISYLVVLVNVLIYESVKAARADFSKSLLRVQLTVVALVLAVLAYGFWRLASAPAMQTVALGVVQPNIPQDVKWEESYQPWIVQKTIGLTHDLKDGKPDLIVWPETSIPGAVKDVPEAIRAVELTAAKIHIPLLFGAITDERNKYYNSVYMVSAAGRTETRYDKLHLVPFGEFFPLRPLLGWIYKYVGLADFTPGREYTIFHAANPPVPFGVLICFEDTVSYVRRNFVKAGAGFFVNMTNDAWFKDTKAPFMHLQAAVFGCVENKRSLVRAANTGFSGFVDPFGRIIAAVEDARHKKTFVSGAALARVPVAGELTFYTKYGDVFTALCLFAILWAVFRKRPITAHI